MSNPLPTTFEEGQTEDVSITLDAASAARKRAKERLAERMVEARELEKFGNKVMKVKLAALTAIGADVIKMGVKNIGHGRIAVSGDLAHSCTEYLVDLVHDLRSREKPPAPEVIIAAMKEIRAFNQQLMDSGKAHIDADKQAVQSNTGTNITFPFPAGTPMVVGIAPQKSMQVEDPDS
jgi:hypothetical protein